MVSQETPITLPNSDEPYENTIACSQLLHRASADARFLGMIPNGLIIDRRNPEANIFLADESEVPADITVTTGYIFNPSLGRKKPSWASRL